MPSFVKTWIGLKFWDDYSYSVSVLIKKKKMNKKNKGRKSCYYLNMQTNLEQAVQETPCSLLPARCFQCLVQSETIK